MVTVTIYFGWIVTTPAQIDDLLLESLKTWDLNRPTTVPSQRCTSHLKNDKLGKAKNDGAFSAIMKDQQFLSRYNFWELDLCYSNSSRGASHCCSRGGCLPAGGWPLELHIPSQAVTLQGFQLTKWTIDAWFVIRNDLADELLVLNTHKVFIKLTSTWPCSLHLNLLCGHILSWYCYYIYCVIFGRNNILTGYGYGYCETGLF